MLQVHIRLKVPSKLLLRNNLIPTWNLYMKDDFPIAKAPGTVHLNCSLSLWRVVRGSKLMHLDLIHGLFIT